MSIRSILLVIICVFLISCTQKSNLEKEVKDMKTKGYELVWHDEFNESGQPDSTKWGYEHGFVRNKELQWYRPENAYVKDGLLILEARKEQVENPNYDSTSSSWKLRRSHADFTSASINTEGKQNFKYGIFTIRAKIDTSKGMWPAIWAVGNTTDRYWPASGEIDIMEYYLADGFPTILGNAAWAGEDDKTVWDDKKIPLTHFLEKDSKWVDQYHLWKMVWTEEQIKLLLDEELINKIDLNKTHNPAGFNPFHHPQVLRLNLAVGSSGGDPYNTQFPRQYKIDYVRVYQKK